MLLLLLFMEKEILFNSKKNQKAIVHYKKRVTELRFAYAATAITGGSGSGNGNGNGNTGTVVVKIL